MTVVRGRGRLKGAGPGAGGVPSELGPVHSVCPKGLALHCGDLPEWTPIPQPPHRLPPPAPCPRCPDSSRPGRAADCILCASTWMSYQRLKVTKWRPEVSPSPPACSSPRASCPRERDHHVPVHPARKPSVVLTPGKRGHFPVPLSPGPSLPLALTGLAWCPSLPRLCPPATASS